MSLHVSLLETKPTEVYVNNITHNCGKMAGAVELSNGKTLYDILWRPDECEPPLSFAKDITESLEEGLRILRSDPEKFKQYNPENGWGSYDGLCNFVREYLIACLENPEANVQVCR
jgi:hypothetical protein